MQNLQPSLSASQKSLLEQLDRALAYRLILLVAPPGTGKTALLRRWSSTQPWRVVWLALDQASNNLAVFLDQFAAAARSIGPAKQILENDVQGTPQNGMVQLINALADVPEDLILILDNYQVIDSPQVNEAVALLLDYPPPHLHTIIASRVEPALPLGRLLVRRQLVRIPLPSPSDYSRAK